MVIKIAHYFAVFLCFVIPVAWWTRLNANYYSTKLTLLFLVGAVAWLAIPQKVTLPKLPKAMLISVLGIIGFQVVKHTYMFSFYDYLNFGEFISFAALVLWFYSLNHDLEQIYKKTTYVIFITIVAILGVSLYEFYLNRIVKLSTDILAVLGTFGNVNMFAEFLVLALPFLFYWTRYKDKIPVWIKLSLFSIWIFFILYCRSRSAWLGFAFWIIFQFRYKITKRELVHIGLGLIFYFISIFAPTNVQDEKINAWKSSSLKSRQAMYEATFELIKDHPWGIRPGTFLGEIEPYQMNGSVKPSEFQYYDQPHSEFLKWTAQLGWLFLVLVFVFLFSVVWQLGKWFINRKNPILIGSFAALIPQLFFQFPFENPASLMFLGLLVALFFKEFAMGKIINIHFSYRPIAYILFLAGVYNSVGFVNSVYQESTFPRSEKIIAACDYYPISFKTCHAKLGYFLDNKQFDKFIIDYKANVIHQPLFVDYLRLLPTYYSVKQNAKKTCEALFFYKSMFPEQQAFESKYYEDCKGFTNFFYFDEPKKYKARYLAWLDNLN
ncbi:MAG: O-antigen ligase family protein [Bdellovibrionota bacterium]